MTTEELLALPEYAPYKRTVNPDGTIRLTPVMTKASTACRRPEDVVLALDGSGVAWMLAPDGRIKVRV